MIFKAENYRKYLPVIMWGLLVALCLLRYAEPIKDGDLFWHLKYGEYHVQNKTTLMDHSIYSWTPAAKYAPYCTWAADVLLYLLFQAGGFPLLYAFMYALLFFPVLVAGRFAKKAGTPTYYGLIYFILIILELGISDAAFIKPELFSLVYFVLIAALYFNLKIDGRNEKKGMFFLFLPLIFLFWANMHGVFFMGLALLAAIVAGEMINYLTKSKHAFPRRTLTILMISGVLSVAATLLTPYGTNLFRHLLELAFSGMPSKVAHITPAFQNAIKFVWVVSVEHHLEFWGIMTVSFLVLFFTNARKNRDLDFGLLLPTTFLALINLKYIRASFYWPPFWALSILYLSSRERVDLIAYIRDAKPVVKRGLVALLAVLSLFFPIRDIYWNIHAPERWSYFGYGLSYALTFQESAFLKENPVGKKLFNSYNAGSYLIFDLSPDRKVFIDNRCFPYQPNNMWEKYFNFRNGKTLLKEMESEFGFDSAVITHEEYVLNPFLESKDWKAVFYGIGGVVFVHNDVKFSNDITKLDRHRFDGLKNMVQGASIVTTAQNLNDLDTADYVLDIMKNKLSRQRFFDYFYSYCTTSQKGLRAFSERDYERAFKYLWQIGFSEPAVRVNRVLKTLINYKVEKYVKAEKYQEALNLIARLFSYYKNDEDVMYNAGVIAYLASKQAENAGIAVKLPAWRETFYRLLVMDPDHPHADIAKKLLANGDFNGKVPLVLDASCGMSGMN